MTDAMRWPPCGGMGISTHCTVCAPSSAAASPRRMARRRASRHCGRARASVHFRYRTVETHPLGTRPGNHLVRPRPASPPRYRLRLFRAWSERAAEGFDPRPSAWQAVHVGPVDAAISLQMSTFQGLRVVFRFPAVSREFTGLGHRRGTRTSWPRRWRCEPPSASRAIPGRAPRVHGAPQAHADRLGVGGPGPSYLDEGLGGPEPIAPLTAPDRLRRTPPSAPCSSSRPPWSRRAPWSG
jgi:hypothetical protein